MITTKRFDIGEDEYTVAVTDFTPGSPCKLWGEWIDFSEPEDWEIQLDDSVEVSSEVGPPPMMPLKDFVLLWATEKQVPHGQALELVEVACAEQVMEEGCYA